MNNLSKTRQQIPTFNDIPEAIVVGPSGVWDLADAHMPEIQPRDIAFDVAEAAIRLAEEAGAPEEDVETLSMLLESARGLL